MKFQKGKAEITRKEMKKIRALDHHQLETTLGHIYDKGYAAGQQEESMILAKARVAAVRAANETKGIGERRRQELLSNFEGRLKDVRSYVSEDTNEKEENETC